jgi:tetratricopeptide (TPR) repeat protein
MQVLMLLLDANGAVITRMQIFDQCWGGVMVGDDSINRAIARLRRVLATVAPGAFEIETIPRTGYRLVPISHADQPGVGDTADGAGLTPQPNKQVDRRWVIGAGLAAAGIGVAAWVSRSAEPDPAEALIEDSRIAMRSAAPEAQRRAIKLLERAVAVSPDSAKAWGLLALTLARVDEHTLGSTVSPPQRIAEAANRAIRLDKDNADALAALAVAVPYYGDWLAAERRFDQVLAKHPDHLFTRDSRAFLLGAVGRMRESAQDRLRIFRDTAFEPDLQHRNVYALWFLKRVAEADQVANRGLEMWPGHAGLWFGRLWVLAGTGRLDRALAHVDDQATRPKLPPPMIDTLRSGILAAQSRDPREVDVAVARVMGGVARSVAAVVNGMMLLNLLGATDRVFDLAEAYYLERGPVIAAMQWRPGQPVVSDQRRRKTNMLFTPTAAAMQRDPRFLPLMKDMGLVDYWNRRGIVPDFLARPA